MLAIPASVFLLAGCGSGAKDDTTAPPTTAVTTPPPAGATGTASAGAGKMGLNPNYKGSAAADDARVGSAGKK